MNAEKEFLTIEEIDKLFAWIYDSNIHKTKRHATSKEINSIYAKWINIRRGEKKQ